VSQHRERSPDDLLLIVINILEERLLFGNWRRRVRLHLLLLVLVFERYSDSAGEC
jgi:hypothetical protein